MSSKGPVRVFPENLSLNVNEGGIGHKAESARLNSDDGIVQVSALCSKTHSSYISKKSNMKFKN